MNLQDKDEKIDTMHKIKISKIGSFIISSILHLLSIGIVILLFYPIGRWYFSARPLFGIDFFNTVSFVNVLQKNIVLSPMSWIPNWFSGMPYISQYPVLNFYAILPFSFFFSIIDSTLLWMVICTGLFFVGAYLFFWSVSSSRLLSILLTIGGIYSVGVYGALLWGGSLPFYATQFFFPWLLWMIVRFIQSGNKKWFYIVALSSGLAIWAHPQVVLTYLYPGVTILILFSSSPHLKLLAVKKKIFYIFVYGALSFLVGLPLLYPTLGAGLKHIVFIGGRQAAIRSTVSAPPESADVKAYYLTQPHKIYFDTNKILFVALGLTLVTSIILFFLKPRKQFFLEILPYLILALYFTGYIWIFAFDISIYHGGWFRLFWSVPIWLGGLSSVFWHAAAESLKKSFLARFSRLLIQPLILLVVFGVVVIMYWLPVAQFSVNKPGLYSIIAEKFKTKEIKDALSLKILKLPLPFNIAAFILRISDEGKAAFSSAYPMSLNTYTEDENLKKFLLPNFLQENSTPIYRLYSADATFNISWTSYSEIPLARGYIDPPIKNEERGYLFWLDAAVNVDPTKGGPGLVEGFGYPEQVARNHALFLIDWNAIRYFQGGGTSSYSSPINNLIDDPNLISDKVDVDIATKFPVPAPQRLKYLQLKPEYTSPIVSATNATTIGIFASDGGYETIVRSLAATNLNSRILIPIKLGKMLDKISSRDLEAFDTLILYDYDYKNKNVFKKLAEFVKQGGSLILDSGVETKESDNRKIELPEIFPFVQLERKGLGTEWDLLINQDELIKSIDIQKFSPPLFDDSEWKFAYPDSDSTRNNEEILITNQAKPVLTLGNLGKGKILWSGMNLFYHVSRFNNLDEGIFLKNIIGKVIDLEEKQFPVSQVERSNARTVIISGNSTKGILLKEQFYPGWRANIKTSSGTKSAKIFSAGASFPGYMYVRLPKNTTTYTVTFRFSGSLTTWILMSFSLVVFLILMDNILLNGLIFGRFVRKTAQILKKKTEKWWEKDDEQ